MSLTPTRKTISINTDLFKQIEKVKKEKGHGSYTITIKYLLDLQDEAFILTEDLVKANLEIARLNTRAETTLDKVLDRLPAGGIVVTATATAPTRDLSPPPAPPVSQEAIKKAYNGFDQSKYEDDKLALQEELRLFSGAIPIPSQLIKITKPKFRKTKTESLDKKGKRMKKYLNDIKKKGLKPDRSDLLEKSYVLKHGTEFVKEKKL